MRTNISAIFYNRICQFGRFTSLSLSLSFLLSLFLSLLHSLFHLYHSHGRIFKMDSHDHRVSKENATSTESFSSKNGNIAISKITLLQRQLYYISLCQRFYRLNQPRKYLFVSSEIEEFYLSNVLGRLISSFTFLSYLDVFNFGPVSFCFRYRWIVNSGIFKTSDSWAALY